MKKSLELFADGLARCECAKGSGATHQQCTLNDSLNFRGAATPGVWNSNATGVVNLLEFADFV